MCAVARLELEARILQALLDRAFGNTEHSGDLLELAALLDPPEYEISYGIDRLSEPHAVEAGTAIHETGREIARLACRPETIRGLDLTPLFDAKLAAGQSWCPEADEWRADCVVQ